MPQSFPEAPLWAVVLVVALGVGLMVFGAVVVARHPRRAWGFVRARFALDSRFGLGLTVALVGVGGLFWAFSETVESWTKQEDLYRFDEAAHRLAQTLASPAMTALMKGATAMGSLWVAVVLTLALVAVLAARRAGHTIAALGLVMGPGEGLVYLMKTFFERVRPTAQLVHAGGYSFPSGHSFTAAALYGFAIYLLWNRHLGLRPSSAGVRVALSAVLGLLILAVGASRIYLGVHYFTDVVGGFVLAAAWLVAALTLVHLFTTAHPDAG